MSDNFLKSAINKISFFRLSGIRKFIVIDIHKRHAELNCIKIKEPPYQLSTEKLISSYHSVHSENIVFNDDLTLLKKHIREITKKFEFENSYLVIGINEYRTKIIKLNKDIEEKEIWFLENTGKFLPEGRIADDFIYSYYNFYEDDENEFYLVNIARKSFIDNIVNVCQVDSLKILNISPFVLAIHTLNNFKTKKILYLNITSDKIIYSYSNEKDSVFTSEVILNPDEQETNNNISPISSHDIDHLEVSLKEIKQNLLSLNTNVDELFIYFSHFASIDNEIAELIETVFSTEHVNEEPLKIIPGNLNSLNVINSLYTNKDVPINLLTVETDNENREQIEKDTTLKIVLTAGVILIFSLLSIFFLENWLNNIKQNNEISLMEIDSKTNTLETYKAENNKIKNNLSQLTLLKNKRVIHSLILDKINSCIDKNCCFSNLSINKSPTGLEVKVEGLTYTQNDVTNFVNRIENLDFFKDVSLEYSNIIERSKLRSKAALPKNKMISFSISASYDDYQK